MKLILHIDNDSYFVSAHRTIDPTLHNIPVVISENKKRSIVSSASYEAKKFGIRAAMPVYKAKNLCPDVRVVKSDFALYVVLSNNLFELLSTKYTSNIEVASIDECYMDATDILKNYKSVQHLCEDIQKTILEKLKLPISIGAGRNKFIAKMSTAINKPYGITITKFEDFPKVFWKKDVSEMYGIGHSTADKLKNVNVRTIGDLVNGNYDQIERVLGKRTHGLVNNARGHGSDFIDTTMNELKSIGNSRTYNEDVIEESDVFDRLSYLCNLVALRMKNRNVVGDVLSVSVKKTGGLEIKAKSKQEKLQRPIMEYEDIFKHAKDLLLKVWDKDYIKYLGVSMSNIKNMFEITKQKSIYDVEKKKTKQEALVDQLNRELKYKGLKIGSEAAKDIVKEQNQSRYLENDRIRRKDKDW